MSYIITQEDLLLATKQQSKQLSLKIEVLNSDNKVIGTIMGIVGGTVSIDANSDIRRTANITLQPTLVENIKLSKDDYIWLNRDIRMFVGLYNFRTKEYKYYPLGYYVYTDTSSTYDATTNQLSINCADFMKKLDGTKNGQLGALKILYPAYVENEETGEVISYNHIRDAIIETLETLGRITNHRIDDVGEYYAMPENNPNWEIYRENHETWNAIPFDQEFACGCSVLSILTTFRDLYPSYEMYFDSDDNTFICQLIPTCYDDDLFMDNDTIQSVLISENNSVDLTVVKNVCEVWGNIIEADFYNEEVTYASNTYSATIDGYDDSYYNGDTIALKIPSNNLDGAKININGLGAVNIYHENDDNEIGADTLLENEIYVFKIKKKRIDGNDVIKAYLLGQWQVHALSVLTDGKPSGQMVTSSDGEEYELYSKEYFKKFYNCDNVNLTVVEDSPFTIQKLGELLDVKTGGEFENITSNDLALERADWENWKNCRLTDNITITTLLLPFLDVNKKIAYKPSDADEERQYIIQSISHDFSGYTTTITMYRFYPLYM